MKSIPLYTLLLAVFCVSFFNASNANAALITGFQDRCVDVDGSKTANGTPVSPSVCRGAFNQQWNIVDGQIKGIGTSAGVNKCLDIVGGGTANGTRVQLSSCNGTGSQVWSFVNGQIINTNFKGAGSGKCLDFPPPVIIPIGDPGTNFDTRLQIFQCNGGSTQRWKVR